jgi:hypothetical protein
MTDLTRVTTVASVLKADISFDQPDHVTLGRRRLKR